MVNTEIKIKLEGLQIGMYVSRIDRAWAELPIKLEGVIIKNNDEIDMLRRYCQSVYVDSSKGRVPAAMYWIVNEKEEEPKKIVDHGKNEYEILRKEHYQETESLDGELDTAKEVYNEVQSRISQTFDDLKQNKALNISALKDAVNITVNSVVRNPTALKLVMELQRNDNYSYNHALSTSVWCAQFGRHLGLEKKSIADLSLGGLILDIGKTIIPDALLSKRGRLNNDEIKLLRSHVDEAVKILIVFEDISYDVIRMISSHHERANGSGYPQGLLNKDIPIYGRIAGIVDSFDAMTSKRPFTDRILSPHEAISQLYDLRGKLFQADLVEQFIQAVGLYPTGSLVELNTGEIAVVTAINGLKRLKPTIMLILDKDKLPYDDFKTLNLSEHNELSVVKAHKHGAFGIQMDDLFL
ncbi:MAG: DUF3391 domain-containing protein [Gammaproteobacteria bacterium]|nr:DUF3391 domain-containing protein [Gammaproteobacteria bacterium]